MEILEIIRITIAWMILAHFLFFYDFLVLKAFDSISLTEYFRTRYLTTMIITFSAGLIGGTVIVFYFEKWVRSKPYGIALSYILICYSVVFFIVVYIGLAYQASMGSGSAVISDDVATNIFSQMYSVDFARNFMLWLIILFGTMIALMVRDKYGPGVFFDFIRGKYFRPKKEERIFMFLDIRSSTTIAERLGEERYFNFLKDFYSDVTSSILYSFGEIYQYVGDEVVVSWKMDRGLQNANCLRCFFDIQDTIRQKGQVYKERYNLIPEFKAGYHYGNVVAGEIGVLKRDITFSGDVLNTASRIQNKCNELGVNILLSKFLLDRITVPPNIFQPKRMGSMELRGKQRRVILYTI